MHRYSKTCGGVLVHVRRERFEDIEESGREQFIEELRCELAERRYRPVAVLRVMIPKPNGGERPLGNP